MQSKFGLKDLIIVVLLIITLLSVWLVMFQRDRVWDQVQDVKQKSMDIERQLVRMEGRLESGLVAAPAAAPAGGSTAAAATPGARDESWARPGVKVEWQPAWTQATDPRQIAGYQPGGEFTEIFEAQPAKITPFVQTDVYGRRIVDLVMESLAAYEPKSLKLQGVLAEAWQMDPAGLWLRAKIRDSARFSDGQPVMAEDLRWTFHDFVMNPQIEAERDRSTLRDSIKEVRVVSERVVEFDFVQPLFSNKSNALTIFVLPKHFYSKLEPAEINKSTGLLVGSGPFKLESISVDRQWSPPEPIVLVRNEQYSGVKASLDRVRFKAIDQELARLTEYKNGLADMITPAAPQFVAVANDEEWRKTSQNLNWVNMRSGRSGIIWNCGERNGKPTPFTDKRVRRAMTLLLDRERMVRDIWKGVGQVAKGFFNPGTVGDDPDLKPWPYNPAEGKKLLKEAGWEDRNGDGILEDKAGNPFAFEVTSFGGGEIAERLTTFIKDSYAAAGIRVSIRIMDWSVGDPVRNQRDFDAMMMAWGANAPESDAKQIFHSDSIANQGDNFAQWRSEAGDKAIDAARREMDDAKRDKLWRELDRVMHEEQPYTWVRVAPYLRFVKSDVKNVNTYPKGLEYAEFYRGGATPKASAN